MKKNWNKNYIHVLKESEPGNVDVQIKRIPKIDPFPGCVCAGSYALAHYMGTLSTWSSKDIDLFLTRAQWNALPHEECTFPGYLEIPVRIKKGLNNVQYIWLPRLFYTPQNIIHTFDITICQVAMFLGYYYITNRAIKDIRNKTFHTIKDNIHNKVLSEKRIQKYKKRGFKYLGHLRSLDDILFKEEGV